MQKRKSRPVVAISEFINDEEGGELSPDSAGIRTGTHKEKEVTHVEIQGNGFAELSND